METSWCFMGLLSETTSQSLASLGVNLKFFPGNRNCRRSIYALLFFWLVCTPSVWAQFGLRFQRIGLDEGLSSAIANAIIQDNKGFLWIGTQDGLDRYDGYRLTHFKHDPDDPHSISDNNIFVMCQDGDEGLWVGTDGGGLNHYDPLTGRFQAWEHDDDDPLSLSSNEVTSLARDADGILWIGTKQGLNRKNSAGQFKHFFHNGQRPDSLRSNVVTALLLDSSGTLWVGTTKGLSRYDTLTDGFRHYYPGGDATNSQTGNRITSILEDKQSRIWVGTEGGLFRFNDERTAFQAFKSDPNKPDSLSENHVKTLFEDSYGRLWVGTQLAGLNLFNPATSNFEIYVNRPEDEDSLSHNQIHCIFEDRSGVLWIGTTNGLSKYNSQMEAFSWYRQVANSPYSLGGRLVWTVFKDRNDDLWMGTDTGLSMYRGQEPAQYYTHNPKDKTSLSHNAVRDIYEDNNGEFWIATRGGGLNRMDREKGTFEHYQLDPEDPKSISHNMVWTIFEDSSDRFWLGTAGGGLNLMDRATGTFTHFKHDPYDATTIASDQVSSFLEDGLGNLWIGTFGGGLDRYDMEKGVFRHHDHDEDDPTSLTHNRVLSIHQTPNDRAIWIGTWGGLNRMDQRLLKIRGYRQKDGLPSEVVYGILSDDKGLLWLSTNKGLCRFDPSTEEFKVFTLSDGLQSNEFNSGAYFKSTEGQMFFGGIDGLTAFWPHKVREDTRPPIVALTDLLLDNNSVPMQYNDPQSPLERPISHTKALSLQSGYTLISFEFAALHFAAPEKNEYAYMLEGYSDSWLYTNADRRFATYSKLKHGRYRFRVKASNKDGVWSEPDAIDLTIRPPLYLTPLAIMLYIITGLLIIGTAVILYRRKRAYKRQIQEKIRQSEERLKFALWGSGDEHWDWDLAGGSIYRSNQTGIMPFPEEQQQHDIQAMRGVVHEKDYEKLVGAWNDCLSGRTPFFECTYRVKGNRGQWIWVLDRGKVVGRDEQNQPSRISGTIKDISHLKETEDKLRLIAIAFENTSDGVFITDGNLQVVAVNQAYSQITGRASDEVLGKPFRITEVGPQTEQFTDAVMNQLQQDGQWHGELLEVRKDGEQYQQELRLDMVPDQDDEVSYYVGVFSDITFRKKAEAELRHLANYDTLTNLPNRTLFNEHLEQSIHESERTSTHFAILFIDLDNFKNINDSLGHSIGDLLLVEVGKRLSLCIRAEDVVARFGGDEFSVLLKEIRMDHGAARVADKILGALSEPFDLQGHNIVISPSIGIVLFPSDGNQPEELLRNADTAMYHAKSRGKNNFQFFTDEMNQKVLQRLQMEADLRIAIDEHELTVYFQPKVSFATGEIIGMEALVRWISPKHGFVNPGAFIGVAEETGLVVPLGKQVLEMTCQKMRAWVDEGLLTGRVAVNLSALQFRQKDLVKFIDNTLAETGLASRNLELEITEGTLMENADYAIGIMRQLRDRNISLAIDDFGTGFSSLSYLKRFPVTSLKVDRSFVVDMAHSDDDHTIVSSIVILAHNLGLKVVAEGVEDYSQVQLLRELGCEEMQGFLFSKPLPADDFEQLLRERANLYTKDASETNQ